MNEYAKRYKDTSQNSSGAQIRKADNGEIRNMSGGDNKWITSFTCLA
jgi:hypothetical protein